MKMKWKLLGLMLFSIVALTYCTQEYLPDSAKDTPEVMFNFSASLPDVENQTRAANITRYIMEVYKTAEPTVLIKRVEQAGGTIVTPLASNTNYTCLFWADGVTPDDNANGTFDASSLKNVTLNTGKEMDEAFFARLDITNAATTFNVTLKRATAKVNIVTTQAVTANTDLKVTYNEYIGFNTSTSDVMGAAVASSKTFNSTATEGTLGTFLTFASVAGILTDFTALYNSAITNEIKNTPLKANYVTNIRGNYAAGDQSFTIIITVNDIWKSVIPAVAINVGTVANPTWIEVADRNAEKDGTNGATATATATDYGYYYQWSNATTDPTNADKAHRACFDFAEGNGLWRLPTQVEWAIVAGNSGADHSVDANRKLKWDGGPAWKLYDERIGQESNFVYFPMGGYRSSASGSVGVIDVGNHGTYWTSTPSFRLGISYNAHCDVHDWGSLGGYNVRCVRNI